MTGVRTLVSELADFRRRAGAMKELLLRGDEAVEPLVVALGHPMENVRWAAARLLGQLGDARAIPALERVPAEGAPGQAAREALARLRGNAEIDIDAVVDALTAEPDKEARGQNARRVIRVSLPEGRTQKVMLDFDARGSDGERLVLLYSPGGPAAPASHEAVLRANTKLRFGAFAIADVGDKPHYVAVATHAYADIDVATLERTVQELATTADALEKRLSNADRF